MQELVREREFQKKVQRQINSKAARDSHYAEERVSCILEVDDGFLERYRSEKAGHDAEAREVVLGPAVKDARRGDQEDDEVQDPVAPDLLLDDGKSDTRKGAQEPADEYVCRVVHSEHHSREADDQRKYDGKDLKDLVLERERQRGIYAGAVRRVRARERITLGCDVGLICLRTYGFEAFDGFVIHVWSSSKYYILKKRAEAKGSHDIDADDLTELLVPTPVDKAQKCYEDYFFTEDGEDLGKDPSEVSQGPLEPLHKARLEPKVKCISVHLYST